MQQGLLDRESIRQRLLTSPPLIEGTLDLETQLQPNGIDLTLRDLFRNTSAGAIDFSNASRRLPVREPLIFGHGETIHLDPGGYIITFNEVVHLPLDLAALGRTRSSLLRCGVALHTAVWDAGYSGRSESLIVVHNPDGFTVKRNARVMQLIFFHLTQPVTEGYSGAFRGEHL